MAYGRPDWSMPWALWGGSQRRDNATTAVASGDNEDAVSISGKGQVVGGWLEIFTQGNPNKVYVKVIIDGVTICNLLASEYMAYNYTKPESGPVFLVAYDPTVNDIAVFCFSPWISFEVSLVVNIAVDAGVLGQSVVHDLAYSLM